MIAAAVMATALHLVPRPRSVVQLPCAYPLRRPLVVGAGFDAGALDELRERFSALHIAAPERGAHPTVRVTFAPLSAQSYRMTTDAHGGVAIEAGDAAGAFYAAMSLAQLPQQTPAGWSLPCVRIADAPALQWRILSDDVSRGPLPTMRYFRERIRTIAAFKMNGYSPYMEHVFVDPRDPLPAPLDGITPQELHALSLYAARYHVAFIPEQQTFAHMHNTLRLEEYAQAAEEPHSFLLSPASALSLAYERDLLQDELVAIPHPTFFHIGADETSALGDERSRAMVAQRGRTAVYSEHIRLMNDIIKPSGARIMLWDDGIQNDPSIMQQIPRNAVIVNWHYGNEPSFSKYIQLIARGGFAQMIAPGDSNWNQIFPDVRTALANENTFITEGKRARVLGLFQTVWHDDGESLFEATWYPVLYAGASAWEADSIPEQRFQRDFPYAFFGSSDERYGEDIADLANIQAASAGQYSYSSNYLMWADAFGPLPSAHMDAVDVRSMRLAAERVETHLLARRPPLHANAAAVMFLAARKYDFIGRKFQAAHEIAQYYSPSERGLAWSKYWFWELRDGYEELAPLYAAAWRYEDRESHLASNLERYHAAAQQNVERADRVYEAALQFSKSKTIPPLSEIIK